MISNIEQVKEKLRPFLVRYLEDNGVQIKGNMFKCINPAHDDHHPSMSIGGTEDHSLFRCLGCGAAGDIFTAAHYLEDKPLSGIEFLTDNLQYLADRYHIPYETRELTLEEKEAIQIKHLYDVISNLITENIIAKEELLPDRVKEYIQSRGINDIVPVYDDNIDNLDEVNPYRRYGMGWVENYDDFISRLQDLGFDQEIIKKADIKRTVFNPDSLIFTLRDKHNSIVAFAARNCLYEDGDDTKARKYMNTSASNGMYKKKYVLYNLHNAIRRAKGHSLIYIVEGYTDAIALDKNGLPAVAITGTTISSEHIQSLASNNLMNIMLVLDGDNAGQKGINDAIVKVFSGIRNVNVKVVELPDGYDPASFIEEKTINEFLSIEPRQLFAWYLDFLIERQGEDRTTVAQHVVPLIVNESSYIEREKMIKILSAATDISEYALAAEVDRIDNIRLRSKEAELANIVDGLVKTLTKNPADAYTILSDGLDQIEDVQKKYEQDLMSVDEFVHRIQGLSELQKSSATMGFELPGMGELSRAMAGNWRGKVLFFGGDPNAGKTNFMINLAMSLIQGNRGKISILYHSTDDSAEDIITRFLTYIIFKLFGYKKATINNVEAPTLFADMDDPQFLDLYDRAVAVMQGLANEGTLVIKDSQQGNTFGFGKRWIEHHRRQYPGRDIVYIADNFHNFNDFSDGAGMMEGRWRIKKMGNFVKTMAVKLNITVLSTVEYRKKVGGERQNMSMQDHNERVAEAKSLEYISNFMGHLLNPVQTNSKPNNFFEWNNSKYPIIELLIGKNKITATKGIIPLKHYQESVVFEPLTEEEAGAIYERGDH